MIQSAILFLYRRLFFVVEWFRKACYVLMGLVFAWFVAEWVSDLALCQPVEKLWNIMMPDKCGNGKDDVQLRRRSARHFGLLHPHDSDAFDLEPEDQNRQQDFPQHSASLRRLVSSVPSRGSLLF
jgi:hypothetical protein